MAAPLEGKGAIVTGASRGIGAEIARELARQGASILITYARSSQQADDVVEELKNINSSSKARFKAIQADAAKATEAAEKIVAEATVLFDGHIDIIVNNAANGEDLELSAVTQETFDASFHPNVLFPLLLVKFSKPVLAKKARIVNLSSVGARISYSSAIMYGASKAALESITKSLAQELGLYNPSPPVSSGMGKCLYSSVQLSSFNANNIINTGHEYEATVNAVNPGPVRTQMWSEVPNSDQLEEVLKGRTPAAPRLGEVNDIAPIVAFLCQEESRWVTASVLNSNGGLLPV